MQRNKELAQKWAQVYLESEEGKLETERIHKEAVDYIIFGTKTSYLNEELLDEMGEFVKVKEFSLEDIINRFGEYLTEEQLKQIRNGK